jgi:hypothetical protein
MGVILRSKATKNLIVTGSAEILRGVYPEYTEGLRMTSEKGGPGWSCQHSAVSGQLNLMFLNVFC